jgi:hypothetical protein
LYGKDPDPLRHQLIEIPPITPLVIEHRLHHLGNENETGCRGNEQFDQSFLRCAI